MIRNRGIAFKLIFFILTSSTIIFMIIFGYNYIVSRNIIEKNIRSCAENVVLATANKIDSILEPIEATPQSLAAILEGSSYSKEQILDLLRSVVGSNDDIYGMAVAYEPYTIDKNSLGFAPYYYKSGGKLGFNYLSSDSYRYFRQDWYQIPKELDRPLWSEPYYDEGGGNIIMATYSVPIHSVVDGKAKFTGIVTADMSLSWLQEMVSAIKIGKTGYGFLISQSGRIVTHPTKNYIMNETIFDLAESRKDPALRSIGREMVKGATGFGLSTSIITGKKCWLAYAPVSTSGWSLGVVFPQDELMESVEQLNRVVFVLGLFGFIFLLVVIVVISGSITRPLRTLCETTKDIGSGHLDFDLSRIRSRDEVGKLAESFEHMKNALKKYIRELTETTASKERMESELKIAHDIQLSIVPKIFPPFPNRNEFDIYAVLEPAKEVGGDFYDFFFVDDKHFCIVVGDVVGKGVPAALFMAVTKTLIKTTAQELGSPEKVLAKVNKELSHESTSSMFVTIFCGVLDIDTGEFWYSNAGHNPPLFKALDKEPVLLKGGSSLPIGLDENASYEKEKTVFAPGDAICLYTDGVTEAFNKEREQFSEERLRGSLQAYQKDDPDTLVKKTLKDIRAFSKGAPQSDDITLLVLRYDGVKRT